MNCFVSSHLKVWGQNQVRCNCIDLVTQKASVKLRPSRISCLQNLRSSDGDVIKAHM